MLSPKYLQVFVHTCQEPSSIMPLYTMSSFTRFTWEKKNRTSVCLADLFLALILLFKAKHCGLLLEDRQRIIFSIKFGVGKKKEKKRKKRKRINCHLTILLVFMVGNHWTSTEELKKLMNYFREQYRVFLKLHFKRQLLATCYIWSYRASESPQNLSLQVMDPITEEGTNRLLFRFFGMTYLCLLLNQVMPGIFWGIFLLENYTEGEFKEGQLK